MHLRRKIIKYFKTARKKNITRDLAINAIHSDFQMVRTQRII